MSSCKLRCSSCEPTEFIKRASSSIEQSVAAIYKRVEWMSARKPKHTKDARRTGLDSRARVCYTSDFEKGEL